MFRGVKCESGDQHTFMKALLTVAGYAVCLEASNVSGDQHMFMKALLTVAGYAVSLETSNVRVSTSRRS